MIFPLFVALYSFVLSFASIVLIRWIAYQYQWVAAPRADRWHTRPVALFGGVGIFLAFFFTGVSLFLTFGIQEHIRLPIVFFGGAVCIFFVGLADDVIHFKPSTKLIGEIIAAAIPLSFGLVLSVTPWMSVNLVITFVWFLAIMNAVNIIDNMDALAASIVLIATAVLLIVQATTPGFTPQTFSFLMVVALFAAVAGFWMFNRYPASIFMGDAGSLFLGYALAALTIPSFMNGFFGTSSVFLVLLLPVTILAFPLFDAMLVTIVRLLHGRLPSEGGRDHTSHRLVGLGFSEPQAVRVLCGLAAIGGGMAIAVHLFPHMTVLLSVVYVLFLVFVGVYLERVKVYPEEQAASSTQWTPLVSQLLYKRHIGEVLLDIVLIGIAYVSAHYLRFEGIMGGVQPSTYLEALPVVVAATLFGFYLVGVYRGIWHLVTVADIGRYLRGVIVGVGLSVFFFVLLYRFQGFSRAAFVIFGILLFLFVLGSRLSFRLFDDFVQKRRGATKTTNVLIYGAGRAGKLLYDECVQNPAYCTYRIIGFLDDDPVKRDRFVAGIRIYDENDLGVILTAGNLSVHELWVSSSRIEQHRITAIRERFATSAVPPITTRRFTIRIDELSNV